MRVRSVTMKPQFASKLQPADENVAQMLASIKPLGFASSDAGIVLPESRATKQRNFAFCSNPECAENGLEFRFEIEQTLVPCPKCGATRAPMVGMLAKTHLLIRDKKGNFEGASGLRYRIGCDPHNKRTVISTTENHELATGDRQIANCIDCLLEANKQNVGWQTGSLIKPQPRNDWN